MTTRPQIARVWASDPLAQKTEPEEAKYLLGWEPEIPTYQVLNYLQNKLDLALLALAERGVMEWDGTDSIVYNDKALAWDNADKQIYVANKANPQGQPSVSSDWDLSAAQVSLASIVGIEATIQAHIDRVDNPHQVTAAQVDTYTQGVIDTKLGTNDGALTTHKNDTDNPHEVTAAQAGAVPITGGAFTGLVEHQAGKTVLNKGVTPSEAGVESPAGGGMHLYYGDSKMGVDAGGNAYYFDGTTTYDFVAESEFAALKAVAEPDYAIPEPDFHMPLISDVNIYTGFGSSNFSGASNDDIYYWDKDGVMRAGKVDEPMFEKEGLLLVDAVTNLVPDHTGQTGILFSRSTLTVGEESPRAVNDGVLWQDSTINVGSTYAYINMTRTQGKTYTVKVIAKSYNGYNLINISNANSVSIQIDLDTGSPVTLDPEDTTIRVISRANGWKEIDISSVFTGSTVTSNFIFMRHASDTGDAVRLGGISIVEDKMSPLTTGQELTGGNNLSVDYARNFPVHGESFTIALEVEHLAMYPSLTNNRLFETESSLSGERFRAYLSSVAPELYMQYGSYAITINLEEYTEGFKGKFVFRYDADTATLTGFLDGVEVAYDTGGYFDPTVPTKLYVGNYKVTGYQLQGNMRGLTCWHKALTNEQISTL